ncbi:MAG: AAA family ATPase [Candidatus Acidiferrum sp.]
MCKEIFRHFGLQRNPFHVSPDPQNFYSTAAHDEALLQLVSRIQVRQGFMVLTGEAGTGKTTVLQYLLDWLRQFGYSTAYVFHPLLPFTGLLQLILVEFGISCVSPCKKDQLLALKNWLIDRHRAGDCPVILVDEAQALKSRTLNELRRLLDFEIGGARLVQIVLAGQPRLEEKLNRRKLSRLRERIMCHCKLSPLTLTETSGYIATRLATTGAIGRCVFPEAVVHDIFQYSSGIPRVINLICEHALLTAYAAHRDFVNSDDVLRVAQEFDLHKEVELEPEQALQPRIACESTSCPEPELPAMPLAVSSSTVDVDAPSHTVVLDLPLREPEQQPDSSFVAQMPTSDCEPQASSPTAAEAAMSAYTADVELPLDEAEAKLFLSPTTETPSHEHAATTVALLTTDPVTAVLESPPESPSDKPDEQSTGALTAEFQSPEHVAQSVPTPIAEPEASEATSESTLVISAEAVSAISVEAELIDLPLREFPQPSATPEMAEIPLPKREEQPTSVLATESQFPEHVAQSVLVLINESETCEPISESTLFLSAEAMQPISIETEHIDLPLSGAPQQSAGSELREIPRSPQWKVPLPMPGKRPTVFSKLVTVPASVVKIRIAPRPTVANLVSRLLALPLAYEVRFIQYWRAVGHSFVLDLREFHLHCATWLRQPMTAGWNTAAVRRRLVVFISAWLR